MQFRLSSEPQRHMKYLGFGEIGFLFFNWYEKKYRLLLQSQAKGMETAIFCLGAWGEEVVSINANQPSDQQPSPY